MATTLQQVTPSEVADGSTPARDECKRKVVGSTKAEQSCKFKVDPLVMKVALEIEAMR